MRGAWLLMVAHGACGAAATTPEPPRGADAPPTTPLVVTIASGQDLDRIAALLPRLGGPALQAWMTPRLGDAPVPGLDPDAPRRRAMVDEDTWTLDVGLADPAAFDAALAVAWPEARREFVGDAALLLAADRVIVRRGAWAVFVEGGAPSTRHRAAVELAEAAPPTAPPVDLVLELDGPLLVGLLAGDAAALPSIGSFGDDLGRVSLGAEVDADGADWSFRATPRPGSLLARLFETPARRGLYAAPTPLTLSGAVSSAEAARWIEQVARDAGQTRPAPPGLLTGDIALGRGLSLGIVELSPIVYGELGRDYAHTGVRLDVWGGSFGPEDASFPTPPGIALHPRWLFDPPQGPPPPDDDVALIDDNPDVPWSLAYRRARDAAEAAHAAWVAAHRRLRAEFADAAVRARKALPPTAALPRVDGGVALANGRWAPAGGLAGVQAALDEVFAPIQEVEADLAQREAEAIEAVAAATRQRAADVVAHDQGRRGP